MTLAEAAWEVALSPWMGAPMVRDLARRPVPAAPAIWLAGFAAALALTLPAMAGEPRTIKDCPDCPEMVVVPAGEFMMGSPPTEKYRGAEALHRVAIAAPFAVSRFEVTFGQWDACRAAGACGDHRPDDLGWGGADHPVINITWEDAVAYVDRLSKRTGQRYRLLSEAEWEYAARTGTDTPFWWGSRIGGEAYRRPLTAAELNRLMPFYDKAAAKGGAWCRMRARRSLPRLPRRPRRGGP